MEACNTTKGSRVNLRGPGAIVGEAVIIVDDIIEGWLQPIGDVSRTTRTSTGRHYDLLGRAGRTTQDMSANHNVCMDVAGLMLRM